MNELELYKGEWKPDFIAFDRYERDCFPPRMKVNANKGKLTLNQSDLRDK